MNKFSGPFTMRMKPDERKQYEELAETHGFGTLAELIRACPQVAIRDIELLIIFIFQRINYKVLMICNKSFIKSSRPYNYLLDK
jgi:hypothetical protein